MFPFQWHNFRQFFFRSNSQFQFDICAKMLNENVYVEGFLLSLSLPLSLPHTHTHTHIVCWCLWQYELMVWKMSIELEMKRKKKQQYQNINLSISKRMIACMHSNNTF